MFTFEAYIHYYCRNDSFTTFFKTKPTLNMKRKQYRIATPYNNQSQKTHPPNIQQVLFNKNLKAYSPIIAQLFSKDLKAYPFM